MNILPREHFRKFVHFPPSTPQYLKDSLYSILLAKGDVHIWGVFLPRAQWMLMQQICIVGLQRIHKISFYHLHAFSVLVSPKCLPANRDISLCPWFCLFSTYTLRSVTMTGHVKYRRNSLACKMQEDPAYNTGNSACNAQLPVLTLATHCHTTESVAQWFLAVWRDLNPNRMCSNFGGDWALCVRERASQVNVTDFHQIHSSPKESYLFYSTLSRRLWVRVSSPRSCLPVYKYIKTLCQGQWHRGRRENGQIKVALLLEKCELGPSEEAFLVLTGLVLVLFLVLQHNRSLFQKSQHLWWVIQKRSWTVMF